MKIASWNVNSLNVRLPHVLAWCDAAQPDVLALQETKLPDDRFPAEELKSAGYHSIYSGQKTYNGVAVLSRQQASDPITDIPGLDDPQRRILAVTVGDIRIIDLYVVNGSEVGSEKFGYKLHWLDKVTEWIGTEMQQHDKVVVLGDFNIAPDDRDVYDPAAWEEKILCSTPERDALKRILGLGLIDTFRLFDQEERIWSWWDYRMNMFRRKLGLRIDLVLASSAMTECCTASYIDIEPRRQERPSDHAPAIAEFDQ
ncbi:MAG: exodeoxyribonuclease III [Xanthomonadales bacterium]|jgi:exodeoxyribonuclease-3|nr:exodeoxyribonuclease III [Xanthomonadales bacterium]MDH3922979.1 exodeoxyribonuclease III [Xanthomonadales bacterium]MDH3939476.1 exodeoxyribonuclease III [Xanthomonadales bacterium]MDH3999659.1 exodeoxyribonuclease III [Xanthomonadales bacterium]